jgi:inorganic pyrophosphatase/exopolyphosphatase
MIILPCPIRPDLDCTAGAVAYAAYMTQVKGQEARAWICGTPDAEAQFYLDRYKLSLASDDDAKAAEAFILVDFSVGHILPAFVDHQKIIQVIDHRFFNQPDKDFPNAVIQLDAVGAAATQITEYYMRDNIAPSTECAAMLYGAIGTHTLFLNSTTTTDRDRIAHAWLKHYVPDADALIEGQLQARVDEITGGMPDIFDIEMKHEKSRFGDFGITQLELRGAQNFWNQHKDKVLNWAATKDYPIVINILDPFHNRSVIYSRDENYTQLLSEKLAATAVDGVFLIEPGLFRKQIIPLLQ